MEITEGKYQDYYWVQAEQLWGLDDQLVTQYHLGLKLGISAFDGGFIQPLDEEVAVGWVQFGEIMVSPPLYEGLEIPSDYSFDEWYIGKEILFSSEKDEVFVNFGFSLIPPEETYLSYDPSWEKGHLDYLIPLQGRFWQQMEKLNPETYISKGGGFDIIVTKNKSFLDAVLIALS